MVRLRNVLSGPCVNTAMLFMLAEADMDVVLIPFALMFLAVAVLTFQQPWREPLSMLSAGIPFVCFAYWADTLFPHGGSSQWCRLCSARIGYF